MAATEAVIVEVVRTPSGRGKPERFRASPVMASEP